MKQRQKNNGENEKKFWFFKKINKIGKTSSRLTKNKRERTQITKTINEK